MFLKHTKSLHCTLVCLEVSFLLIYMACSLTMPFGFSNILLKKLSFLLHPSTFTIPVILFYFFRICSTPGIYLSIYLWILEGHIFMFLLKFLIFNKLYYFIYLLYFIYNILFIILCLFIYYILFIIFYLFLFKKYIY